MVGAHFDSDEEKAAFRRQKNKEKVDRVLALLTPPPAPPAVNVNPIPVHVAPPAVHLDLNWLQEAL